MKRCKNCGRCFDVGIEYIESLNFNDIEITSNILRIYNKVDKKLTDMQQYDLDKITNSRIIEDKLGYKLYFNYKKEKIIIKINSKQATKLENLFEVSKERVICSQLECDYLGLLIEGENCPECGKPSKKVGPVSYDEYMNGRFGKLRKGEKRDKSVIEYICLNPDCVNTERLQKYQKCPECGHSSGKIGPVKLAEIIHKKEKLSKKLEETVKKDIIKKVSINKTFKGIAGHIKLCKHKISINEKRFVEDTVLFGGLIKLLKKILIFYLNILSQLQLVTKILIQNILQ